MKKFFPAIAIPALFTLFSCNGGSAGGDGITLKFNLPKGSGYDYNLELDMTMQGKANGHDVNMKNRMSTGYRFGVENDSAGWKKLTSNITRIAVDMSVAGMNVHFDSDQPGDTSKAGNTLSELLSAMKGQDFSFTMNEKGEVGQVTGIQEMMQRAMSSTPGSNGGTMMPALSGIFNEENFKQNIQQSFSVYPGKPVKPGDSWTNSTTVDNQGMPMKMDNTYTLESVSGDKANVKMNSKISSPQGSPGMQVAGTMAGIMKYDIATGVPLDGDLSMNMKMTMNSGGQAVPMSTVIRIKVTGKKI